MGPQEAPLTLLGPLCSISKQCYTSNTLECILLLHALHLSSFHSLHSALEITQFHMALNDTWTHTHLALDLNSPGQLGILMHMTLFLMALAGPFRKLLKKCSYLLTFYRYLAISWHQILVQFFTSTTTKRHPCQQGVPLVVPNNTGSSVVFSALS